MREPPRNLAASVHDRLLNRSRATGEDFNFLLQRYGSERFLYRLGESKYRDRFVLKGAALLALWGGSAYRATRDLDLAGYGSSDADDVIRCFQGICAVPAADDGLVFDGSTIMAQDIRLDAEYDGLRIKFLASLGGARINMQVDIGFGNAIDPPAEDVEYPTLLDAPAPLIRAYPLEASLAEKLHAMVVLGELNSRYKDFYDVYVIASTFALEGARLTRAISATFERRSTEIDSSQPTALTARFFADDAKSSQWRAYLSKNQLAGAPADFSAAGEMLLGLYSPLWTALAAKQPFEQHWAPGGPWATLDSTSTREAIR